tara:strand:- start:12705 stop:13385 length:681 start_codon:yes stop_codon:yes gene_type:complete
MERRIKKIIKNKTMPNRGELMKAVKTEGILLSILIPTLYSRREVFAKASEKIMRQIEENNLEGIVELISHFDNKTVGLSYKRTNMIRTAGGKFIAYFDDDDDIGDTYIKDIIESIINNPDADVITFKQHCNCDGREFYVESGIEYELNMNKKIGNTFYRYPWIWCIWRREKVVDIDFKDPGIKKNYGEDGYWLQRIKDTNKILKEVKIEKILHYYKFSSQLTETQK